MNLKRTWRTALIGAAAMTATLACTGTAMASTSTSQPVSANTSSAAVATPAGSFHIPVVPYPFSGSWNTPFTLYTLPSCSSSAIGYEVFLSTQGVEQDYPPPLDSTFILYSDTNGPLFAPFGPSGTLPTPFRAVDFSISGLNGFITGAGNYSLGVKCFSNTALTNVWWTTVHFDGPATPTSAPNWSWEPLAGGV